MALILSLETTTKVCSVAIALDGKLITLKESNDQDYGHAEKLNVYIEQVLKESGYQASDLHAVAIAGGPGSYTGLRIGASSAKGLCYALNIPLISIDPLKGLFHSYKHNYADASDELIFSMIDARRDEVFMAVFDRSFKTIEATSAQIINDEFLSKYEGKKLAFIGDGAAKFEGRFEGVRIIKECVASAAAMVEKADLKFTAQQFEDLAYYEPFYGKDFQTTVSTKLNKIHTSNE